jgi:hypothetical protein
MSQAESAIERLYEDPGLRDELREPEANFLLQWAENQIMSLAEQYPDQAAFDAKVEELRARLKSVNRFIGRRSEMDEAAKQAKLAEIIGTSAQAVGTDAPDMRAAEYLQNVDTMDDSAALQSLTALFAPAATAQAAFTDPAEAVETAKSWPPEGEKPAEDVGEQAAETAPPDPNNADAQAAIKRLTDSFANWMHGDQPTPPTNPPPTGDSTDNGETKHDE